MVFSMWFSIYLHMSIEFQLFEGKNYNDLLKDIVVNSENKRDQIDIIISDLRDKIVTINDALILAPIIQSYLDIGIKNDESLVKLAAIVQRLVTATTEGEGGGNFGLTDLEKEQLLKDIKNIGVDSKSVIDVNKLNKK